MAGVNHARHALDSFFEATDPILHRMPERGLAGQFRAHAQNLKRQLSAARRELSAGDDDPTPLPTGESQTFRAVKPGGLAENVGKILDEGKQGK
jgi:hypothetical protein